MLSNFANPEVKEKNVNAYLEAIKNKHEWINSINEATRTSFIRLNQ